MQRSQLQVTRVRLYCDWVQLQLGVFTPKSCGIEVVHFNCEALVLPCESPFWVQFEPHHLCKC